MIVYILVYRYWNILVYLGIILIFYVLIYYSIVGGF